MRSGNDHRQRANGVALSSQGETAGSEASELYGDYESKLANELTELLHAVPHATARGAVTSRAALRADTALANPTSVNAGTPAFIPAARPYNDFVDDGSAPPISTTWRNDPEPEPAGIGHHVKHGAAGLLAGLALVVPLVLFATGRLDIVMGGASVASRIPFAQSSATSPPTQQAAGALQEAWKGPASTGSAPPSAETNAVLAAIDTVAAPRAGAGVDALATHLPASPPSQAANSRIEETAPAASAPPQVQPLTERPEPQAAPTDPTDPVADLMSQGLRHIGGGDIAAAREAFSRAASTGDPAATMALAETFDPNMLAAWGARDISADVGTARMLYGKALEAGVAKARMRIDALN